MLKRIYEVACGDELLLVKYDKTEGIAVEGYDIEAQRIAETLTGEIGLGMLLGVVGAVTKQHPEEQFGEIIEEWIKAMKGKSSINAKVSSPIALAIALFKDPHKASSVASNPHTHHITLQALLRHKSPLVRTRLASNPSSTPAMLKALLGDSSPGVSRAVLENPNTGEEVLSKHWNVRDEKVSLSIAKNPNTPSAMLEELFALQIEKIQIRVASHSNASPDLLKRILTQYNDRLFMSAIRNKNHRKEDVVYLIETLKYGVPREAVSDNLLSAQAQIALLERGVDCSPIAFNTKESEVMEFILNDKFHPYHRQLAHNNALPLDMQHQLAKSEDREILTRLAANENLDEETYRILILHKDPHVRRELLENDGMPKTIRDEFIKNMPTLERIYWARTGRFKVEHLCDLALDAPGLEAGMKCAASYSLKSLKNFELLCFRAHKHAHVFLAQKATSEPLHERFSKSSDAQILEALAHNSRSNDKWRVIAIQKLKAMGLDWKRGGRVEY